MHRGCAHELYVTKEMHPYSAACSLIIVFAPSCPCFRSTRLILTGKTVCCLSRLRVHIPIAAGAIQAVLHAHVLPLLTSHKKHKLTHHRKGPTRQCIPNLAVGKSLHLYIAQSTSHAKSKAKQIWDSAALLTSMPYTMHQQTCCNYERNPKSPEGHPFPSAVGLAHAHQRQIPLHPPWAPQAHQAHQRR